LEDGRGKNDKVSREVWKTVETNAGKIRVAEAKGRGDKRESMKEARREEEEEKKAKERKNSRSEKGSRRMGNMG